MSKIAWITDQHFGFRKGSDEFLKSQLRFIREQFIPELKAKGITKVVFGGDLFEYRVATNVKIANAVFDLFKDDFSDFECYILAGNHDIYYNNTVKVNSIRHLGLLPNVTTIEEITPIDFYGKNFLLVPWQTDNSNFSEFLSKSIEKYDVCMCHYAIHGFLLNKSKVNTEEGIPADIFFNNFKLVISGHFHSRSSMIRGQSKIQYTAAPWHLSRIDIGEDKGAMILDTDTLEYEFLNNTTSIRFVVVKYPEIPERDFIKGNIIDIYVECDKDYDDSKVYSYIQEIESMEPAFPPIVKITNNFVGIDLEETKFKTTHELIQDYINVLDINNKDEIYNMILDLYNESKGDN